MCIKVGSRDYLIKISLQIDAYVTIESIGRAIIIWRIANTIIDWDSKYSYWSRQTILSFFHPPPILTGRRKNPESAFSFSFSTRSIYTLNILCHMSKEGAIAHDESSLQKYKTTTSRSSVSFAVREKLHCRPAREPRWQSAQRFWGLRGKKGNATFPHRIRSPSAFYSFTRALVKKWKQSF